MTDEEKQKEIERLQGEIFAFQNLLQQKDYVARKMLAEVCAIVKEKLGAEMPIYEHYLAQEQKAQFFRDEINRLEKEIEELKK